MPNYVDSFGDVVTRGIGSLARQTNIRQAVAGSKARSLIEVFGKEIDNLSVLQDKNLAKAFLPTASGQFLEHLGATVGLTKYQARNAEVLAEDRVFRFYVRGGGTFGSINNNVGFTIPAGTRMTAPASVVSEASGIYIGIDDPDSIFDRSVHYTVTSDVSVASADQEVFVSAKAATPGSNGNLAAPKMVRTHSFTSYNDYLAQSLLVENVKPILNGINAETDISFRYRISQAITAAERANFTAIANAARSVPGVSDVLIVPMEDGAGRFNVYIKAISSIVSDKTVASVQNAIDSVCAVGTVGYARKPYEIGVEISTTITFRSNYSDELKSEIRTSVTSEIIRYLNSMPLGKSLSLSDLSKTLKSRDSRIATVGFNKTTLFDSVFAWYPAKLATNGRSRERLILETLAVPPHARIIAETSISDPVRVS
jgi:uncharacterized phage protein gp47/JayE